MALTVSPRTMASMNQATPPSSAMAAHSAILAGVQFAVRGVADRLVHRRRREGRVRTSVVECAVPRALPARSGFRLCHLALCPCLLLEKPSWADPPYRTAPRHPTNAGGSRRGGPLRAGGVDGARRAVGRGLRPGGSLSCTSRASQRSSQRTSASVWKMRESSTRSRAVSAGRWCAAVSRRDLV